MTPISSSIRLGPKWHAFDGVAHGLRQPTLQGGLEVFIPNDFSFTALDAVMGPLISEELPEPPAARDAAESLVDRLLHWQAAAQRQQKIPVFGTGRIVAASRTEDRSRFVVAVPYHAPKATQQTLEWMVARLNQLLNQPATPGIGEAFEQLLEGLRRYALNGINNFHLLRASHDLDIPARGVLADTYCYGYGAKARWLNSTQTDQTSVIGAHIAASKSMTAHILRLCGLPAPRHAIARDEEHARQLARGLGYPVVVKPDDQEQGRGVAAGLRSEASLIAAYQAARAHSSHILVEKHHEGEDYRLTVLGDRVVKILHRRAGGVVGDGVHTVDALVALEQEKPRFKSVLRQTGKPLLNLDEEALGLLSEHGLSPQAVPAAGDFVVLRRKSNISAGGIQTLVPVEQAHADNIALAVRATRSVQLDLCGVDLLLPDISRSWLETGAVIIELNSKPQVGYALAPEVYGLMLQRLLGGDGRVPLHLLVCATGADGPDPKASQALMRACKCNGLATGQGVWIDGRKVSGAQNGFEASRALLLDKAVTGAVCILTAQEILSHGLPADRFDRVMVSGHRGASGPQKVALEKCLAMIQGSPVVDVAAVVGPSRGPSAKIAGSHAST